MSKKTKTILAVVLLLVVVAAVVGAYFLWGPPAQKRAAEAQRAEAAQTAEAGTSEPDALSEGDAEPATQQEEIAVEPEETEAQAEEPAEAAAVTITFVVVHGDGSQKEFTIATDAVTLREALEQEGLIAGTESEWGLYVLTVDGETADEGQQQWWCLTKDGEMSMTGVDDTVIADGEHYEFTLTTGW